jgi:hypothetical protein
MFHSDATPLRDRIAAALVERGLDPDDPFGGDDEAWASEDLAVPPARDAQQS